MAKLGYVQNGVKKNGTRRKKRRNGAVSGVAKTAVKRNGTTLAGAKSFAKRNGLKLVSKSVANPKRRKSRKRRNGLATASGYTASRRNGILGNTRSDAKKVAYIGGGALGTKGLGRVLNSFISPYLSQLGAGGYTEIICDGIVALVAMPFIGGKLISREAGDLMRLGGLLTVGLDVVEMFAPDALQWSPFNSAPVVLANGQAAVAPKAVAAIVASTDASASDKAKVAGAMRQLERDGVLVGDFHGGDETAQLMPLMNE